MTLREQAENYMAFDGCDPDAVPIISALLEQIYELAQIMVDAELITRSRCHEITGMSHSEIGKLLANSPIAKDAAKQCIDIAGAYAYSCGCSGLIVADIVDTFHLSV